MRDSRVWRALWAIESGIALAETCIASLHREVRGSMFTIVVPTRNRANTLQHSLETCVDEKRDDLTILVSDNMSADNTREVIREFEQRDARVKYITPGKMLSMALHHQFALEHCKEGFVGIIGDDDGLIPGGFSEAARLINEYPTARAISWVQSDYLYPDSPYSKDLGWPSNFLSLARTEGSELRSAKQQLRKVLSAREEYFTLPGIYHSLIHTSVLKEVQQQSSGPAWINEPAPDVYMFVTCGLNDIPYVFSQRSITLRGASKNSVGAAYFLPSGDKAAATEHLQADFPKMHPDWDCPLRPIPTIIHSCLQRAIEAGLPHEDFSIDWENVLRRTVLDLRTAPPQVPQSEAGVQFVQGIAKRLNRADVVSEALSSDVDTLRSLIQVDSSSPERDQFELEGLGTVANIHDACQLAGHLYNMPSMGALIGSLLAKTRNLQAHLEGAQLHANSLKAEIASLDEKLRTTADRCQAAEGKQKALRERFTHTKKKLETIEKYLNGNKLLKLMRNLRLVRW